MADLILHLIDSDYQRLQKAAERAGKSIQDFVRELIVTLPLNEETYDVTADPLYLFEGFDVESPTDLSTHVDRCLYQQ